MPPGFDPGTAQLVAQCLNHCATPGPHKDMYFIKKPHYDDVVENEYIASRILNNDTS